MPFLIFIVVMLGVVLFCLYFLGTAIGDALMSPEEKAAQKKKENLESGLIFLSFIEEGGDYPTKAELLEEAGFYKEMGIYDRLMQTAQAIEEELEIERLEKQLAANQRKARLQYLQQQANKTK